MLKIITSTEELNFSELMQIYIEGNISNGRERYPNASVEEQLFNAQQDFYHYLNTVFFRQDNSLYAIWEAEGHYRSALRLEPYADGLLLCALETAPNARQQGCAAMLISAVQGYLARQSSGIIYSHISKKNKPSLAVHRRCGFEIIKDHAVYSDGSVLQSAYTLAYQYEKSET